MRRVFFVLPWLMVAVAACSSQSGGTGAAEGGASSSAGASGAGAPGALPVGGVSGVSNGVGGATAQAGGATSGGATSGGATSNGTSGSAATNGGAPSVGGAAAGIAGATAGGATGIAGATTGGTSSGGTSSGGAGGLTDYDPCPAKGTPCVIMPMGDSITEGVHSSTHGGYRSPLFHLALQDKKSITFVGSGTTYGPSTVDGVAFPRASEGVGGRRISDLVAVVPQTIITNKPNILLLEIGTNNIRDGATSMASQLAALLDKIIAADDKLLVVVATVIPGRKASDTATVKQYDELIPGLVQSRAAAGKHITMVDMFTKFTADPNYVTDYFADDLHPNDTGYALMADVWYAGIKSLLR